MPDQTPVVQPGQNYPHAVPVYPGGFMDFRLSERLIRVFGEKMKDPVGLRPLAKREHVLRGVLKLVNGNWHFVMLSKT